MDAEARMMTRVDWTDWTFGIWWSGLPRVIGLELGPLAFWFYL